MTDSFAQVAPPVTTPPPPVVAPAKKQDRTFTILLAVGLLIAVGGVTFAIGRVTAPAAAAATSRFAGGGFGTGGTGAAGTAAGAAGRGAGFGGVLLTGTVESISGTTMTLKEANGSTVTVDLPSTTTYHAQAAATAADVTAGKQVQVQVELGGGAGGFGGAFGGGAGAAGGTGGTGGDRRHRHGDPYHHRLGGHARHPLIRQSQADGFQPALEISCTCWSSRMTRGSFASSGDS